MENFYASVFIAAVVSFLSFRFQFLTANGAIATFILALLIFWFGGLKWSVPILTFFLLSSLLPKIIKSKNKEVKTYFKKSGARNYLQVLANGGLGGMLVILNAVYLYDLFFMLYLSTLSAVCADTYATAIGTWKTRRTYNVLNFKIVAHGVSGVVSFVGTLGAVLGSVTIF